MTIRKWVQIRCPECGEEQESEIWESLNVTLDPQGKDALFNGEINSFRCLNCQWTGMIPVSLLYHDMEKQFLVQYFPFDSIDEENFLKIFDSNGTPIIKGSSFLPEAMLRPYMTSVHIVFDFEELLRYICFRDRLFERNPPPSYDDQEILDETEEERDHDGG